MPSPNKPMGDLNEGKGSIKFKGNPDHIRAGMSRMWLQVPRTYGSGEYSQPQHTSPFIPMRV